MRGMFQRLFSFGLSVILLTLSVTSGAGRSAEPLVLEVDRWTLTNAMTAAREFHTLSVLPDGTALAAGGRINSGSFLNSSEIYNPFTNSWTLVANSMGTHRSSHTATVLLDGRILVAGGENGTGSLSSAEIYDPFTQQWTATGSMTRSRWGHTATRLQDGRILVVGGCYTGTIPGCTNSVEIYNPANGTWTTKAPIATGARREHTATLLPDGSVLVVGGYKPATSAQDPAKTLRSADRYIPATDTWAIAGNITAAKGRAKHSAVLRRDGKVLIMGGYESYKPLFDPQVTADLTTTEIFDLANTQFPWTDITARTTALSVGHQGAAAVLDAEGNFILLGGEYVNGAMSHVSHLDVNSAIDTWDYEFGAMEIQRKNHAAALLPGGVILVVGGRDQDGNLVLQAETNRHLYGSPESSGLRSGNYGLYSPAAVMRPNGDILITGGGDKEAGVLRCHNQVHYWDESDQVFDTTTPMLVQRCGHEMTALPDGRVVVFGGFSSLGGAALRGEIFDGGTWQYLPLGSPTLSNVVSVLLPNGTVFLFQGGGADSYIFDPTTLNFRKTLNPASGTYSSHTATLMKNGKVLIIGSTSYDTVEEFNPLTETFEVVPHPDPGADTRFRNHEAVLLPNGKVMVVGGQLNSGVLVNKAYFYNPDSKTWATGNAIGGGRKFFSLVLLPDGTPVILGGVSSTTPDPVNSVIALNTQTGVWAPAGELLLPRQEHIAHLTLSGKILVIGGFNASQVAYKNVELFNFANISDALSLWKPSVTDAQCVDCAVTKRVRLTGSDFTEAWEGSSGQTNQSPTNQPVVQLYRLDNAQIQWLRPATASSDTQFQSTAFNFPDGLAIAFVYVNGSFQGKVVRLSSLLFKTYLPMLRK